MIIVDTSCWVDHFRGRDTRLQSVLGTGAEMLHPFVYGELLLNGLPRTGGYSEMLRELNPAPLASVNEVAALIEWAKLASTGIGYVDAHLLVSAKMLAGGQVLTEDGDLHAQAERFGVAFPR